MNFRNTGVYAYVAMMVGFFGCALLLASCGESGPKGGPRHKTYPVEGQLFINDLPAAGAQISVHPEVPHEKLSADQTVVSSVGAVDEEGAFRFTTYVANDGLPVGKYKIGITWREMSNPLTGQSGRDRLDGAYENHNQNAEESPELFTFEVTQETGADGKPMQLKKIELTVEGLPDPGPQLKSTFQPDK